MLDADLESSFLAGTGWKGQNNVECSNTTLNERRANDSNLFELLASQKNRK